jgi:trk system potassium uptake protein TrkH
MSLAIQSRSNMTPQQIMLIGFAIVILIGTLLLALPISSVTGENISWINALFTATSAVSLTGLTVIEISNSFSTFGQTVILILIQLGGLGFMMFGVMFSLLLGKRITLKDRLLIQEATRSFSTQGMVKLAIHIILITFTLEILVAIILCIHWSGTLSWKTAIYHAIFHSISAFNNSGLCLYSNSLQAYVGEPLVNICITLLSLIGGIGFTVLLDLYYSRGWKRLSLHSKVVLLTSSILILASFLIILSTEIYNSSTLGQLSWDKRIWATWLQSVSPRSSGFHTVTISNLLPTTLLLMMLLMFIGAGTGSTGGGIKVNTFAITVMSMVNLLKGNKEVNILKKRINNQVVAHSVAIILLASSSIILVIWLLILFEGPSQNNYMAIVFEVFSAFGTVGLSMGITPALSSIGKLLLIASMFIGKIGPLTFAFALTASSAEKRVRYPEDKLLIG